MKMNKVLAVLLSVAMLVGIIPAFSVATTVSAAGVAEIINGGFETNDFTGWTSDSYAHSITTSQKKSGSYSAQFGNHSSVQGDIHALSQVVAVNTGATYTLNFYHRYKGWLTSTAGLTVKVLLGNTATTCTSAVVNQTASIGSSWKSNSMQFSTSNYKYAKIQFIIPSNAENDSFVDDISLTVNNAGDTGTHAKPSFVDFGNELNRPKDAASNVVTQPSFESTTGAPWNTSDFIKNYLSVANDPDAKDGSKVLLYNNPGTIESWHYFDLDLPTGGNYVLSAWVKSPYLSATNKGTASIGIIDPDTNKFFMSGLADYKGHTSTPYLQIRSTATDNQWHLRSVTFFVGSAGTVKIGVYGKQSQLYIDDISVHLVTNGTTYVGDQTGTISPSNNTSNMYCEAENNLIADCNMTSVTGENFWKHAASGWNNGFMNFNKTDARLEFNGTGATGKKIYHYIKWIPVEAGTKYTVSFDYRITAKGSGQLRFLDNNIDLPQAFKTYSFTTATTDWVTTSFTFNSGNYNRIAVAFTDGGGTAYFDDFRIFKTEDGIATEPEEEVYPTLKPNHPDEFVSRQEYVKETGKLGLAFLFNLETSGWTCNEEIERYKDGRYDIDYTNATVDAFEDGKAWKLVRAGVVMTNKEEVGQNADEFTLDNLQTDKTVIDVQAKKAWIPASESPNLLSFCMRIINIPDTHKNALIYARPYYIFEYNGREITVYGDIVWDSYEPQKDVNDGWLEWD